MRIERLHAHSHLHLRSAGTLAQKEATKVCTLENWLQVCAATY